MGRKYRRLLYRDRQIIEQMSQEGKSVADIAAQLGVHRSTIYKEFSRCNATQADYRAGEAQRML